MEFTKEQLSEIICKHTERENGLQDLMEIMIESMMVAERREYLHEDGLPGDKGNGYRMGHTYGQGRTLTFRIPRDRYGNFHPRILAVLRSQEEFVERFLNTAKERNTGGSFFIIMSAIWLEPHFCFAGNSILTLSIEASFIALGSSEF